MKALVIISAIAIAAFTTGCATQTSSPLCRHVVLSQYAAFSDAGYETELWHMQNKNPAKAGGFKYHVAVRIKQDGKWFWVNQPKVVYTTTPAQPTDTVLLRKMNFGEVSGWVQKRDAKRQQAKMMVASTGSEKK